MDRKIREWTLHEEIGRGGMGVVYLARHDYLPGDWAIKVIKPELAADPESRQRFLTEVVTLSKLPHDNIVAIRDPFQEYGQFYLPMEYLSGSSLKVLLQKRPGPWVSDYAVEIISQAAKGVGFAHRQSPAIIHRDLKPGNIQVLSDGRVKVLDFGLARDLGDKSITATGMAPGTPLYMAPEVLDGKKATASSDVYALGIILFRLLAGRYPIDMPEDESSVMAMLMAVVRAHATGLPDVREYVPSLPPSIAAVVSSALSTTPSRRPPDGQGLAAALSKAIIELNALASAARSVASGHAKYVEDDTHLPIRLSDIEPGEQKPAAQTIREPVVSPSSFQLGEDTDLGQPDGASRGSPAAASQGPSGGDDRKSRNVLVLSLVGGILLAVLAGLFLGYVLPSWLDDSPVAEAGSLSVASAGSISVASADSGIQWVRIPGGTFQMGSDYLPSSSDPGPVHTVTVSTFEMAKTETTVAQYRKCVEAGECTPPSAAAYCNWGKPGRDDHPINCVDWYQASTYAAWAGGRLPTEAEWEYAARSGGLDRDYPWGDYEATCSYAVLKMDGYGCDQDSMWPVCSKTDGSTVQGLCDMSGNALEWTSDWSALYDSVAVTDPTGPPSGTERVCRGGSFDSYADQLRAAYRASDHPDARGVTHGLRPVRPVIE